MDDNQPVLNEKKKIGILTFHRSYNYGAFMQCYSLVKKMTADFDDATIEVIDYTTRAIARQYSTSFLGYLTSGIYSSMRLKTKMIIIAKNLYTYIFRFNKIKEMKKRNKKFEESWGLLPLSKFSLTTNNYKRLFTEIKKREYDLIVVGSDAVWNWVIRGFPNAYFLCDDLGAKKLSYAASSYGQDFKIISNEKMEYLSKALGDFSYIGVRDNPTKQFVKHVNKDLSPAQNCDPTVLLDLGEFDGLTPKIKQHMMDKGIDFSKPIIGIMGEGWLGRLLREIVGDKYQIVAVYVENGFADVFLSELTPFEWAKVFSLFTVTFTHFFHGTLLSLENLTPVFAIETGVTPYSLKYDTKIKDALTRLGLIDFYYTQTNMDKEKMNLMRNKIEEFILYPPKDRISAAMEKEAESYNGFQMVVKELLDEL